MSFAYDDFTRADSTTSLGTASSGDTWTAGAGTWGIASNSAYVETQGAGSRSAAYVDIGSPTQDVGVTFNAADTSSRCGLIVRYSDASNFIVFLGYNAATATLYKNVAGTLTAIANSGTVNSAGMLIRVVCLADDTIKVYQNGVRTITANDSFNNTATKAGIHLDGVGKNATWNNFFASPLLVDQSCGILQGY